MSFWPDDEENGGSELTMNSQLRKTRSMDSSCLELRLGPSPGNSTLAHHGGPPHLPPALSRARSEANLHASSLSLGPGSQNKFNYFVVYLLFFLCKSFLRGNNFQSIIKRSMNTKLSHKNRTKLQNLLNTEIVKQKIVKLKTLFLF